MGSHPGSHTATPYPECAPNPAAPATKSQVVSAEEMVGYSEGAKCSRIAKVFDDAYKVCGQLLPLEAGWWIG